MLRVVGEMSHHDPVASLCLGLYSLVFSLSVEATMNSRQRFASLFACHFVIRDGFPVDFLSRLTVCSCRWCWFILK